MNAAVRLMCTLAFALLWAATPAQADVPTEMSVQGRLTNGAGAPVPAGIKLFTFKIFDASAGGTEIWPGGPGETQALATDANGLWNAGVGELIPLTEVVFQSPVRWLEVTVNDGVNPIEILPRIELRTNPYTYRSATSQHADSLGSATYTDLVDQFVDEVGDTMSGPLGNYYTQKDLGSSIQLHNLNDGWFGNWNDFVGTWGISSAVGGDNSSWNVAVAASADGNNNLVDGNYGVLSMANGTGSVNYGILAQTGMSGTNNFSGYFLNGDFVVSGPQTAGTAGVQLPPDAIDDTEISDEPGVASGYAFGPVPLTTTMQDLVTLSITIPDAGYIELQGEVGELDLFGTTGFNWAWVQIDETAAAPVAAERAIVVGAWAFPSAGYFIEAPTVSQVYYKASAGTYTFRLAAAMTGSGTGSVTAYYNRLRALYIPRAYGSVVASVASSEVGAFENVSTANVSSPAMGGASREVHTVDLRDLEIKVARAEAEAEKARRELIEAKASAAHTMSRDRSAVGGGRDQ